jgi:hypothetical protein
MMVRTMSQRVRPQPGNPNRSNVTMPSTRPANTSSTTSNQATLLPGKENSVALNT